MSSAQIEDAILSYHCFRVQHNFMKALLTLARTRTEGQSLTPPRLIRVSILLSVFISPEHRFSFAQIFSPAGEYPLFSYIIF